MRAHSQRAGGAGSPAESGADKWTTEGEGNGAAAPSIRDVQAGVIGRGCAGTPDERDATASKQGGTAGLRLSLNEDGLFL